MKSRNLGPSQIKIQKKNYEASCFTLVIVKWSWQSRAKYPPLFFAEISTWSTSVCTWLKGEIEWLISALPFLNRFGQKLPYVLILTTFETLNKQNHYVYHEIYLIPSVVSLDKSRVDQLVSSSFDPQNCLLQSLFLMEDIFSKAQTGSADDANSDSKKKVIAIDSIWDAINNDQNTLFIRTYFSLYRVLWEDPRSPSHEYQKILCIRDDLSFHLAFFFNTQSSK